MNEDTYIPAEFFQQQPPVNPQDRRRHAVNVIMDGTPLLDIDLPEALEPSMPPLNESYSVAQFYLLKDNVTGVLALGSFSANNFTAFGLQLLAGLQELKALGAKQLVVDVVRQLFLFPRSLFIQHLSRQIMEEVRLYYFSFHYDLHDWILGFICIAHVSNIF